MIKLVILLLAIFIAESKFKPLPNLNIADVIGKPFYVNAILSSKPLNVSVGVNYYDQMCLGQVFSKYSDLVVSSNLLFLPNYTSYMSPLDLNPDNPSEWANGDLTIPGYWENFATEHAYSGITWIFVDNYNEMYAYARQGNGDNIPDQVIVLSTSWESKISKLSKMATIAMRAGLPLKHWGYYFLQCNSYRFQGGGGDSEFVGLSPTDDTSAAAIGNGGDGEDDWGWAQGNENDKEDNGNDTLEGGDGNDSFEVGNGKKEENENDTVGAGNGNDILEGGDGNDTLEGGNGNDTLEGGNGNDVFEGN